MSRLTALKIAKANVDRMYADELNEELAGVIHHEQVDKIAEMINIYYGQEER